MLLDQCQPSAEDRGEGNGFCGAVRSDGGSWGLGEAGVGAAGATVSLLTTLYDAGHLKARVHCETAIPHLRGRQSETEKVCENVF